MRAEPCVHICGTVAGEVSRERTRCSYSNIAERRLARLRFLKPQPAAPGIRGVDVGIASIFFDGPGSIVRGNHHRRGIPYGQYLFLRERGAIELLRAYQ